MLTSPRPPSFGTSRHLGRDSLPEDRLKRNGPPWALAWRLAAGQIVSWGILYYAFTVIIGPMHGATGWSRPFLNLGVSLSLLAWGAGTYPTGWWIQRHGARGLMTLAAMLGGTGFIILGLTASPLVYLFAWLVIGAAMAGLLYEPAFATITAEFGEHYRRGITLITLVGGLASTAFIPLAQLAVERLGWRQALIGLGVFLLATVTPLHAGIPRRSRAPALRLQRRPLPMPLRQRASAWRRQVLADVREPRFAGLALWFAAYSAAFTGLMFQLVPLLTAEGADENTIVHALMAMGPMQVLGRFLLSTRGSQFSAIRVGAWGMGGLLAALLVLLASPPHFIWLALFAALLGLGNGVITIARGTVVAELFGRARYAELSGTLAAPAVLARAVAPLALAGLWTWTGRPSAVTWTVLLLLLAGGVGLALAARARPAGEDQLSRHPAP